MPRNNMGNEKTQVETVFEGIKYPYLNYMKLY